jgi:hypothetical protein
MTIWSRTASALAPMGLPVAANQYLPATGTDFPEQYLVYRLISSPPEQHADNREISRSYVMQVTLFSCSGFDDLLLASLHQAMTGAGFTRGPMRELPYNLPTRHYGLALEFNFSEDEE